MFNLQNVTFQEALDMVESLPDEQQEDLIHIIQQRHIEQKRELLARNIENARAEYGRREVRQDTVDNLMKELTENEIIQS